MANRFPLIVNPDTKEIQEISQNDNLDLTGNGVYAGGSLGSNGQVLTTNGTTVEWRTLTGGGGGGGGIDSDTTYIVEAEDQVDGASLNLIAGGSGVGTIRIKFQDGDQLQFDTTDNLTITPSIKAGSIENSQLLNTGYTFTINGTSAEYALGSTVMIPVYGDVFATSSQTLSNKTFTDCSFSFATATGNTIVSIPNNALVNKGLTINGDFYELGDTVNIVGGGGVDTDTTYTMSTADVVENGVDIPNKKAIALTGSDASYSNAILIAGDRLEVERDATSGEITFNATEVNTDTNTTYSINASTYNQGNISVGAKLNLLGDESGQNSLDSINFVGGAGVTVSSNSASDILFSVAQDISSTSDVQFNSLTLTGNFTVEGATTFVDTTNLVISDKTLTIADGVTNSELANNAGILIGTSNINFIYNHNSSSWQSTSNLNLVSTKAYKIGGTDVLTSTKVLGKSMPLGEVIGTLDVQTLSNKTLNTPAVSAIINTGTVYFPAPTVADTLVGRASSDILTNKSIDGNNNTITNIGNNAITNSFMTINGTQRNLGDNFTITATDPYSNEKAQDAVAGMITTATHSGITWNYDDTVGTLSATVTAAGVAGSDTLADVTGRGATTNDDITLGDASNQPELNLSVGASSGSVNYLKIFGGSNEVYLRNTTGSGGGGSINIQGRSGVALWQDTGNLGLTVDGNCAVNLFYQTSLKLKTTTTGVDIFGTLTSDSFVKVGGTSSEYLMADGSVSSGPLTTGNFSGNFIGNITAGVATSDSFIKNGGTSSEYLMADGSVSSGPITTTSTTGNFSGTFTGNLDAGEVTSDSFIKNGGTSSQYLMADGSVNSSLSMGGSMTSSIIPDTNEAYDLGSAEYKIRHLFLSDNTIYSDSGIMRIAQHQVGGVAQAPTQLISIAKIKEVMVASADFATFKSNIEALIDD